MGVSKLRENCKRLLQHGKDPNTPVAIIERGFSKDQRVVVGKLSDIADIAEKEGISPPAIIVIGDVVKIMEKLKKNLKYFRSSVLSEYFS